MNEATVNFTMCAYCGSFDGGHTLACQAIHMEGPVPAQIPAPKPPLQPREHSVQAETVQAET